MRHRHPVPTLWLMTDERLGEDLWPTLEALPRGAGVIFRDYALPPKERRARFALVARIARRRGLMLLRAGKMPLPGEMGAHHGGARGTSRFRCGSPRSAHRAVALRTSTTLKPTASGKKRELGERIGFEARPSMLGLTSRAVHDRRELIAAHRAGADLILVSPVFATRSHPGARTLGPIRLGLLLNGNRIPAIALGGMDSRRFRRLRGLKLHGWAAIDGLTRQKRNAVPI